MNDLSSFILTVTGIILLFLGAMSISTMIDINSKKRERESKQYQSKFKANMSYAEPWQIHNKGVHNA